MTRLTDEELHRFATRTVEIEPDTIEMGRAERDTIANELQERRRADVDLKRLSDVVRGFYNRNGRAPTSTTMDLCDAIDRLLAGGQP